jgi:hypothetical protein
VQARRQLAGRFGGYSRDVGDIQRIHCLD